MSIIQSSDSDVLSAASTHKYIFIAYVVVLAATVILSILVWTSSNKYQDAVKRVADARTEEAKRGAEEARKQAADALRDAGTANEAAGRANDSAAKANERAQKLEGDNLQLRTDLETATAESRAKQAELAKEQTKLAGEQRKTAEAQREAAVAQLALKKHLEEVAERQKPRRLTPEQRSRLIGFLTAGPKGEVEIWCVGSGNPEPCNFADELADVLTKSGWTIGRFERDLIGIGGTEVGVMIKLYSIVDSPIRAGVLQQALGSVGISAQAVPIGGQFGKDIVRLFIGVKPN